MVDIQESLDDYARTTDTRIPDRRRSRTCLLTSNSLLFGDSILAQGPARLFALIK